LLHLNKSKSHAGEFGRFAIQQMNLPRKRKRI
jgi:hypothetical protein